MSFKKHGTRKKKHSFLLRKKTHGRVRALLRKRRGR